MPPADRRERAAQILWCGLALGPARLDQRLQVPPCSVRQHRSSSPGKEQNAIPVRRFKVEQTLEAGPLSQWLFAEMKAAGLAVELIETRHVRAAFKAMPVKTDRKDARGIAQLMRLGWFRAVHCKSLPAQEVRALLTSRKLLQAKRHDVEMSLRGVLRGFGLKVGPTTPKTFAGRVRALVAHHDTLQTIADALLSARTVLEQE